MNQIVITILLLLFAMSMFIWGKIPIPATSMIVALVLAFTGILTPGEAFSGFTNSNIILFVAMFVVGGTLFQTGMANKIGKLIIKFAKTERQMILGIILIAGSMSAFLSNTAAAAVLMPVIIGIASASGYNRSSLLFILMISVSVGGHCTILGTAGNLLASSILEETAGRAFSFFAYTKIGLPIFLGTMIFYYFLGSRYLPRHECSPDESMPEENFSAVPKWKQVGSLLILAVTVIGMILEEIIGVKMYLIACVGALLLVCTGITSEKNAFRQINWTTVFLIAGMLPMSLALAKTGAGDLIAKGIVSLFTNNPSPLFMTGVLWLLSCFLTQFMSNSAATAVLFPIAVSVSKVMGADPAAALIAVLIGAGTSMLTPIGSPPNSMIYGPGNFSFRDYVKYGLPCVAISFIMSMIFLPLFFPFF